MSKINKMISYCIKCQRVTDNSTSIELKHDKDTIIRRYYIIVFIVVIG